MTDNGQLSVTRIFGAMGILFRRQPVPGFLAFAVLVPASIAIDLSGVQGYNILFSILVMVAQFLVIQALLREAGLLEAAGKPGRVGSFVGAGIVTGIAIGIGLLLAIVPGLYLFARWSMVDSIIIGEGMTMDAAMGASRDRTSGKMLAIMFAVALIFLPWTAGLGWTFLAQDWPMTDSMVLTADIAVNLLMFFSAVASWYLAVALYDLLQPGNDLEEVFA